MDTSSWRRSIRENNSHSRRLFLILRFVLSFILLKVLTAEEPGQEDRRTGGEDRRGGGGEGRRGGQEGRRGGGQEERNL